MKKIYIAAPFFSKRQINKVIRLENALKINPTVKSFYSARKYQQTKHPKGSLTWGKEIYDFDMAHLLAANCVAAIVDYDPDETEMDSGTAYEIGAADILNKPLVVIHTTNKPVNLMISAAPKHANLTNIKQINHFNFDDFKYNDFKGKLF